MSTDVDVHVFFFAMIANEDGIRIDGDYGDTASLSNCHLLIKI